MQYNKALHSSKYATINDLHRNIRDLDHIAGGAVKKPRQYKSISKTMSKKAEADILRNSKKQLKDAIEFLKQNNIDVSNIKSSLPPKTRKSTTRKSTTPSPNTSTTPRKRCPNGYRKDKKTGECVLSSTTPKSTNGSTTRGRPKLTEEEKLARREARKEATRQRKEAEKEAKRKEREETREAKKQETVKRNLAKKEATKKYKEDAIKKLEEHKAKKEAERAEAKRLKEEEEAKDANKRKISKLKDEFKNQMKEFRSNMRMFPEDPSEWFDIPKQVKNDLKYYLDQGNINRIKAKDAYAELEKLGVPNEELTHDMNIYDFRESMALWKLYKRKYE